MVQNDKKFCPSHSISQEPYIIWLSLMVHMCNMIIPPAVFFHFFKILIFWVVRVEKGKKWSKMTKNSVCCARYLRNHISDNCGFWYTHVKWWYLWQIFSFFKILIFGVFDMFTADGKYSSCMPSFSVLTWKKVVAISVPVTFHMAELKVPIIFQYLFIF